MKLPPILLSSPLQSRIHVIDSRRRSIGEPGHNYRPAGGNRKRNPTFKAVRMGSYGPFVGKYNEGALVTNQHPSAIHINSYSSPADLAYLTDHHQIALEPPLLKSDYKSKISRCRHCRAIGHLITSCYVFHTNGEGIIQDDDPSRRFWCSLVYHFPNDLSPEYKVAASILGNPPIREFCCQSAVLSSKAGDYILDW